MVTDGVLDTLPTEKQDSLIGRIHLSGGVPESGRNGTSHFEPGHGICSAAPLDDMTILVTGIWKL